MNNRKSIIAGAILSIMLCVSIVAGATFALFETKDEINISVGSANVKITATIGDLETYSYDATENAQIRTAANGTFTAGGTATVGANGSLVLDRIAAGDKVTFNLNVKNESNIKTKWRTIVKCLNGRELYDGLAITLGGETKTVAVSIELPYEAGNEFLNKNCELVVRAEAVQANAAITEVTEATEVKNSLANGGTTLLSSDIELDSTVSLNGNATLDLNGNTLIATKQIVVSGGNLNITNGKVVMTGNAGYDIRANKSGASVVIENATIEARYDALFVINDGGEVAPVIEIKNSTVRVPDNGYYCISTNAGKSSNHNVIVNIENSNIIGGETAILFNIPGQLNIKNSTIMGMVHGVVVRAGTAVIEDSVIYGGSHAERVDETIDAKNWTSGNDVTTASLVVGNRNSDGYLDASCTLKNVTVLRNGAVEGSRAVCVSGGYTDKTNTTYTTELKFDGNCKIGSATDDNFVLSGYSTETLDKNGIYVDKYAIDKTKISINGIALN